MYLDFSRPGKRVIICILAGVVLMVSSGLSWAEIAKMQEDSVNDFIGESSVPAMLSQPELPLELRPQASAAVRTIPKPKLTDSYDRTVLLGAAPLPSEKRGPMQVPVLLPMAEAEPGLVYIVPFTGVMVPKEVHEGIFDLFVDNINLHLLLRGMEIVILKQPLNRRSAEELKVRKYITGEISSYVEESDCCSTNIHTEVRITYHQPKGETPVFETVIPASTFFEHEQSDLEIERRKLAENIAVTLSERLLSDIKVNVMSKRTEETTDNGA